MKKNFFKFLLLGVFTLSLGAGFVGCKDYDDDINVLTDEIADVKAALQTAKTELSAKDTELQTAITAAQTAADNAKTAADNAKAAGDAAAEAAAKADEKAALAQAAAAQAKTDAVAEAKAYVDEVIANLDGLTAAEVDAQIEAKLVSVLNRISTLEGDVTQLQTAVGKLDGVDLSQIATNKTNIEALQLQTAVLTNYQAALKAAGFVDEAGDASLAAALKAINDAKDVLGSMTEEDLKALADLVDKVDPILNVLNTPLATLKSLGYIPELYVDGIESLLFPVLFGLNADLDGIEPALTMPVYASFRINPSNADAQNELISWGILNRTAAVINTRAAGDGDDLFTIEEQTFGVGETTVKISADMSKATWTNLGGGASLASVQGMVTRATPGVDLSELPQADFLALKAVAPVSMEDPQGETHEIVSDYVRAIYAPYFGVIADSMHYWNDYAEDPDNTDYYDYIYRFWIPAVTAENDHAIVYDDGPYDLLDYVTAVVGSPYSSSLKWIEEYGINNYHYEFEVVEDYIGEDGETDQAWFVDVEGSTLTVVRDRSAIDRTPLIKATLMMGQTILSIQYIKFEIIEEEIDLTPIVVDAGDQGDLPYIELYDNALTSYTYAGYDLLTWAQINEFIYDAIPMSHQEFLANYQTTNVSIDYDHTAFDDLLAPNLLGDKGTATYTPNPQNTSTYTLNVKVAPQTRFGAHDWKVVFEPNDPLRYPEVHVTFEFNLVAPANPAFNLIYAVEDATYGNLSTVKGIEDAGTVKFQADMIESFLPSSVATFKTDILDVAAPNMFFTYTTATRAEWVTPWNGASPLDGIVYQQNAVETPLALPLNGRIYGPRNWETAYITLVQPITMPEWHYKTSLVARYENNDVVTTDWAYRFVNPLKVKLEAVTLKTEQAPSTQELAKLLTVSVLDNPVYTKGVVTAGAPARWSVPAINAMPWSITYSTFSAASKLILSSDAAGTPITTDDYYYVYWENLGTSLATDVTTEKLTVTVTTPYASLSQSINMTIKETTTVPTP